MKTAQALQAALAGEHAACYVYGVIGSRVSASAEPALYAVIQAAYRTHRTRRDQLIAMVSSHGATPVAAAISYDLPSGLHTDAQLKATALGLEERIAETYGQLIAASSGPDRRWALAALDDTAVRELGLGGAPQVFPGQPTASTPGFTGTPPTSAPSGPSALP